MTTFPCWDNCRTLLMNPGEGVMVRDNVFAVTLAGPRCILGPSIWLIPDHARLIRAEAVPQAAFCRTCLLAVPPAEEDYVSF